MLISFMWIFIIYILQETNQDHVWLSTLCRRPIIHQIFVQFSDKKETNGVYLKLLLSETKSFYK